MSRHCVRTPWIWVRLRAILRLQQRRPLQRRRPQRRRLPLVRPWQWHRRCRRRSSRRRRPQRWRLSRRIGPLRLHPSRRLGLQRQRRRRNLSRRQRLLRIRRRLRFRAPDGRCNSVASPAAPMPSDWCSISRPRVLRHFRRRVAALDANFIACESVPLRITLLPKPWAPSCVRPDIPARLRSVRDAHHKRGHLTIRRHGHEQGGGRSCTMRAAHAVSAIRARP